MNMTGPTRVTSRYTEAAEHARKGSFKPAGGNRTSCGS
jgi:hypothetical protein